MLKKLLLGCAVLCSCTLFGYSCSSSEPIPHEEYFDICRILYCEVGFECFGGTCLRVDDCGNPIPDTMISEVSIAETDWPDSCHDYVFQYSFYMTDLHINDISEEEICCYDMGGHYYGGDERANIDNKIGLLLTSLEGLLVDFDGNSRTTERISAGSTVILLEFRVVYEGVSDDPSIIIPFFYGSIDGCTEDDCSVQVEAAAGNGTFTASENFFEPGSDGCSGTPFLKFEQVYMEDDHLIAGPSTVRIPLPLFWNLFNVEIENAWLEADLSYGPNGITMTNGKLGGTIPVTSVIKGFNQYAKGACSCLEVANGDDMVTYGITNEYIFGTCNDIVNNCGEGYEVCSIFEDVCSLFINLTLGQADIDTDGDCVRDSLSIGINFEAVSAQVAAP